MLWENLREEEFEPMLERTNRVCALAIGCLEKHGQHLPLGTDTLKGGKILELAAEREEVCVFPRLYLGDLPDQLQQQFCAQRNIAIGHTVAGRRRLCALQIA